MTKTKVVEVQYDYDVPIPAKTGGGAARLGPVAIAARDCPLGASFFVPGVTTSSAAKYLKAGKALGNTYKTRAMVEDGVEGVRIWRDA